MTLKRLILEFVVGNHARDYLQGVTPVLTWHGPLTRVGL